MTRVDLVGGSREAEVSRRTRVDQGLVLRPRDGDPPFRAGKGAREGLTSRAGEDCETQWAEDGLSALARSSMSSPLQLANSHFRSGESEGGLGG